MYRICFIGVGGAKSPKNMNTDAETLEDAENTALFECRKAIRSNKVMLLHKGNMEYDVRDGMRLVGWVTIQSL